MTSPRKIRILHLIKSLGRGGAEKLLPETALAHDRGRYEFYCLYFHKRPTSVQDELVEAGVSVHYLPSGNFGLHGMVKPVAEFVRQHRIDLIHCHLPWAGVLGRWVGKKVQVPVIYTEHNLWERYHFFTRWLNKWTFHQQDAVICVSEEVKNSIRKNHHSSKGPAIQTIPNAVNTCTFQHDGNFRQAIRKQLGIPVEAVVLGQVAVFRKQKRLDVWVKVAKKILEKHPETHFILVGEGSERPIVEKAIGKECKNIHLVGMQEEVVRYLSAMDLYMITSEFEGLPVAMLEAMSCGLPVLGTDVGGIKEVVRDAREGYLVPIDRAVELADIAAQLIEKKALRGKMSYHARERVVEEFGLDRMVKQLEAVYQHVSKKVVDLN